MSIFGLCLIICVCGAVGGVINALITEGGFLFPHVEDKDGAHILRPGWLGNLVTGAAAAGVSWGLYGPLTQYFIFGSPTAVARNPQAGGDAGITLSTFVGGILIGISGARWLTNEVDKTILRTAAIKAANAAAAPVAAQRMAVASPSRILEIARDMPDNAAAAGAGAGTSRVES